MDEDSLNKQILALLQSAKYAIPLNRIQAEFKTLIGYPIPLKELGFSNIEAFLRSIPSYVRITRNSNGEFVCQPVDDPKTSQLSQMVRKQRGGKTASSSSRGGGQGRPWKPPQRPVSHRPNSNYSRPENNFPRSDSNYSRSDNSYQRFDNNYPKSDSNYQRSDNSYQRSDNSYQRSDNSYQKTGNSYPKSDNSYPKSDNNYSKSDNDYPRPSTRPPLLPTPSHSHSYEIPPRFSKMNTERNVGRMIAKMPNVQTAPHPTTDIRSITPPHPTTDIRSITPPCTPTQRVPAVPIIPEPSTPQVTQTNKLTLNRLLAEKQLGKASYKTTCEKNRKPSRTIYYCTVRYLDRAAQSYPAEMSTAEEAEEEAAGQAIKDILATIESINGNEELPMTSSEFIIRQIFELVENRPNGVWSHFLTKEYTTKFNERLPSNWLEIIVRDPHFEIQRIDDVKSIIFPKKNVVNNDVEIYTVRRFSDCSDTSIHSPASSSSSSFPSMESPSNALSLPDDNFWNVYVSFAESASNLYIRLIGDDYSVKYDNLATNMELHYMDCSARPPLSSNIAAGDLFAVKNEDCWVRVEITELLPDNSVMCYFVDHGDFCKISIESLLPLEPQFRSLPFQALQCKLEYLDGVDIFDVNMKLLECVVGKILVAHVVSRDDILTIILYDTATNEDININELLADMVLTRMESPKMKTGITEVFLKHVTPSGEVNIYIPSPTAHVLESMLELAVKKFKPTDVVHIGKMYIIKHEGTYYRAINTGNANMDLMFLLVDYGDIIPTCLADIFPIDQRLQRIPKQFVTCRLHGVPSSPNLEWNTRTADRLCDLAPKDMALIAKVVTNVSSELPSVELFKRLPVTDELVSINQTLDLDLELFSKRKNTTNDKIFKTVKKTESRKADDSVSTNSSPKPAQFDIGQWNPAESSQPEPPTLEPQMSTSRLPPIGEYVDIVVNLVASPSNFMFQNWIGGEEYNLLTEEMMTFYGTDSSHIAQCVDQVHYAVFHKGSWQRAQIPQNDRFLDNDLVSVYFIDTGEHALVVMKDIRPLDKIFKKLPPQALYGKLAGVRPVHGDWAPEDCYRFKELVEGKPLVAEVLSYEKSADITRVVMYLVDTSEPDTDIHIHKILIGENRACEVTGA